MSAMQEQATSYGREEFVNFLTHGGGLVLSLAGAFVLFSTVSGVDSSAMRMSCWIYAIALIALYGASTLSHSSDNPDRRHFYRSLDQGVIFVFIAANFTPFALAHLPVNTCWMVVSAMWILAVVGFTSKVWWQHRVESISILHYLTLGWLPILAIVPILRSLPTTGTAWVAAGACCYTLGTVFLALDTRVRYFHALWHLLVIAGSSCHFYVVLDYVILLKT